jgi:hypothetical protein
MYVAVSHTWGRWKFEPCVSVSGVPWRIPQNTRFKVEDLPEILQNLGCDYVWLDLLTIPQEDSEGDLAEIRKKEISRQALIFRQAKFAIAWLNDITSWDSLQAAVQYLRFRFLKCSVFCDEQNEKFNSLLKTLAEIAIHPIELWDRNGGPNAWFTSLWTLQEFFLRPDMWLCTKNWHVLSISNTSPVTVSDLGAFLYTTQHLLSSPETPAAVRSLHKVARATGFCDMLVPSRLAILETASHRYCQGRRAEAIMTAVGATKWFNTAKESWEKQLVLNLYPLAFMNEVRQNVGSAAFFMTGFHEKEPWSALARFFGDSGGDKGEPEAVGSLLPLSNVALTLPSNYFLCFDETENCALKSWSIEISGAVRIPEAAIVARSFDPAPFGTMKCSILAPSLSSDRITTAHNVNLHDWIHTYRPQLPNYAVLCTQQSPYPTCGVILKEIRRGVLLKIGIFISPETTHDQQLIKIEKVEWLVL